YLIFNLLASGKVAWDDRDYASAASRWESLLQVPGLDPEIDRVVRPFAEEARKKAGGKAGDVPPPPVTRDERPPAPRKQSSETVTVDGTVSGGGQAGPGGAVITLKRTDGPMPKMTTAKKVVLQRGKAFVPRVLAVSLGSSVVFRNEDPINHNVFSLSPRLDTGLYGAGGDE